MSEIVESITLDFCTISLRSDGLIENRFVWDTPYEITTEKLIEINSAIKSMYKGKRRGIVSIAGLYGSMTPEARQLDMFHDDHTIAIALIIQSTSQRLLANFYFRVKKAPFPVKFFKTEAEAAEWLYQQCRQAKMAS